MKRIILFLFTLVIGGNFLAAQNQEPVAVSDTITIMAEDTAIIYVLQNDYDPDGNDFYIRSVIHPKHGKNSNNDSVIFYRSDYYYGSDSLRYRIKDTGTPQKTSDFTYVYINVLENQNLPYAVNDTFTVYSQKPTVFNLIQNDADPNGDLIMIDTTSGINSSGRVELLNDSSIRFTSSIDKVGSTKLDYNNIEKETVEHYFSNEAEIFINVLENNDIPVAENDDIEAVTFIPTRYNVVDNDTDPGNHNLKVYSVYGNDNTTVEIISDSIIEVRTSLFEGTDTIYYRVQEVNSEYNYVSKKGKIAVHPLTNPDIPVAKDDYVTLTFGETVSLNVLANDYSPVAVPLEISAIQSEGNPASFADSIVTLTNTTPPMSFEDSVHQLIYYYQIREKNNPDIFSKWGNIHLTVKRNKELPAGINDHASAKAATSIFINLLSNDLNPTEDSIILLTGTESVSKNNSYVEIINDSTIKYTAYADFSGIDTVKYLIGLKNSGSPLPVSYGCLIVNVERINFFSSLDINNIKAGVNADGYLFNNYGFLGNDLNPRVGEHQFISAFEAPKGSGINAIFSGSLWVAGESHENNDSVLHIAAVRYMGNGRDFWSGPISDNYNTQYDEKWINTWKVSKTEIKYHINHYNDWGYIPIPAIATWPGNGDVSNGQLEVIAPFYDKNENGVYEPMEGDYPLIRGDQGIFFVYNDNRFGHGESKGISLGIEIHGMAYAFNNPLDSALWNTVFIHYDIINRSDTTYYDTYISNFIDADLGNPYDDYVMSDVQRGAMIAYNGDDFDEDKMGYNGSFNKGYGSKLPAVAAVMLGGPFMEEDGIDNPAGGCDESINGMNFGNGIVDDERWGMQYFGMLNNSGGPDSDPSIAPEYYRFMQGYYARYDGHWICPVYDTIIGEWQFVDYNYMFPGNSDTCYYGVVGNPPAGIINETEGTGGYYGPNPPGDRRGVLSAGPFDFHPGDKQELDMAYVFARSYDGSDPVDIIKERITELRDAVTTDSLIELPDVISKTDENIGIDQTINIFPNPISNRTVFFDCRSITDKADFLIYNASGVQVFSGRIAPETINKITLPYLQKGIYIVRIKTIKGNYYGKFIN